MEPYYKMPHNNTLTVSQLMVVEEERSRCCLLSFLFCNCCHAICPWFVA